MTIEQFVEEASGGIKITNTPGNGGKFGYSTSTAPNITYFGFRTKTGIYDHWLRQQYGEKAAKSIKKLINQYNKLRVQGVSK